ncbi:hypothetical protein Dimus_029648 [Dionaea muscipula]
MHNFCLQVEVECSKPLTGRKNNPQHAERFSYAGQSYRKNTFHLFHWSPPCLSLLQSNKQIRINMHITPTTTTTYNDGMEKGNQFPFPFPLMGSTKARKIIQQNLNKLKRTN